MLWCTINYIDSSLNLAQFQGQLLLELLGIAFCALGAALAAVGLGEETGSRCEVRKKSC